MPEQEASRSGSVGLWLAAALSIALPLLCTSAVVFAHGLQVRAFADGSRIDGIVTDSSGRAVGGARVVIEDAAGSSLAELTTQLDGRFSYTARAAVDHVILVDGGDGHGARWKLSALELSGGFPGASPEHRLHSEDPYGTAAQDAVPGSATSATPYSLNPGLEAAIERAVGRQLRPLREELIAARDAARLRDVLGGIGYIFGLVGLVLWWRSRRGRDRP